MKWGICNAKARAQSWPITRCALQAGCQLRGTRHSPNSSSVLLEHPLTPRPPRPAQIQQQIGNLGQLAQEERKALAAGEKLPERCRRAGAAGLWRGWALLLPLQTLAEGQCSAPAS